MTDFMEKFRKTFEEGLETVRENAMNLKDLAEEYSKVAKLKFELYQLRTSRDKKLTLLGNTVYPYFLSQDFKGLKAHDTLMTLVSDIRNLNDQIDLLQHAIDDITEKAKQEDKKDDKEHLKSQITNLEKDIEERLQEIKQMKEELGKNE